ncbi:MAG: dihydroorotate dehydrogenase (quinone) [Porticoccaceae bacterium]|nr:dihydroorotate dehydrogenase (quinone) [Porticoccaceae bacterium]
MLIDIAQKCLQLIGPESAHDLTLHGLKNTANTPVEWFYRQSLPSKPVSVMGITFPNPVGLAAGLDKDGEAIDAFHSMGFGHIEVGTVTPRPQPGNPKPRLFRIREKNAIINRMGFNNLGVNNLVTNLKAKESTAIVGVNIGKNRDTALENGISDYIQCMREVYKYANYIAVNISSPNTPGLRSLQYGSLLDKLLETLKLVQIELADQTNRYVPLALKIAPDLDKNEIISIAKVVTRHNFDGVIATNTTLRRNDVEGLQHSNESGGLSGGPLLKSANEVLDCLRQSLNPSIPIIAVGGIMSVADAEKKFAIGADLVQIYTGFVYKGPRLIKDIVLSI